MDIWISTAGVFTIDEFFHKRIRGRPYNFSQSAKHGAIHFRWLVAREIRFRSYITQAYLIQYNQFKLGEN